MSIHYCLKCTELVDSKDARKDRRSYFCPKCDNPLYYFGQEQVSLSPKDVFEKYDREHPFDPVKDYLGKGGVLQHHIPDSAEVECHELLKYNPANEKALLFLAKKYQAVHIYQKATEYYEQLLKYYPNHADANEQMGNMAMSNQRFEDAEFYFQAAIEANSDSNRLRINLAVAYYMNGRLNQAKRILKNARDEARTLQNAELIDALLVQISDG